MVSDTFHTVCGVRVQQAEMVPLGIRQAATGTKLNA